MDVIGPVFHPEVKQIRNKDVSQEKDYCREVKRLKEDNSYSNMLPDSLYIHLYNGWKISSWNKRLHGRVPVLLYNHPQTNTLLLEWYNQAVYGSTGMEARAPTTRSSQYFYRFLSPVLILTKRDLSYCIFAAYIYELSSAYKFLKLLFVKGL